MTGVKFVLVDLRGINQSEGSSVDEDLHTRPALDYFGGGIGERMRIEGF
jgi:hypothetical protein